MIERWLQGAAADSHLIVWPLVALVIFFAVFVAVVVWVFRRGGAESYERQARLPLEGDGPATRRRDSSNEV